VGVNIDDRHTPAGNHCAPTCPLSEAVARDKGTGAGGCNSLQEVATIRHLLLR
jgi:hypothetical protein